MIEPEALVLCKFADELELVQVAQKRHIRRPNVFESAQACCLGNFCAPKTQRVLFFGKISDDIFIIFPVFDKGFHVVTFHLFKAKSGTDGRHVQPYGEH